MAVYLLIWRTFARAVVAVGVVLEILTHPLSTVLALAAVCLGVSLCVVLGMHAGEPEVRIPVRATAMQVLKGALLGIVVLTALVGLATMGAATMLFVAAVVVATSPPVVSRVLVVELVTVDVQAMDTDDLVRDWKRSFVALEQARDPTTKMALVLARQAFLDELERRDPSGLHEWLESGAARAASDPTKFMSSGEDQERGGPHAA